MAAVDAKQSTKEYSKSTLRQLQQDIQEEAISGQVSTEFLARLEHCHRRALLARQRQSTISNVFVAQNERRELHWATLKWQSIETDIRVGRQWKDGCSLDERVDFAKDKLIISNGICRTWQLSTVAAFVLTVVNQTNCSRRSERQNNKTTVQWLRPYNSERHPFF